MGEAVTPEVVILLASYRGAAFIGQQLDSIAAQDYGHWSLIVSDDGSDDDTRAMVRDFAAGHAPGRVTLIDGPRRGATQNFLHLLEQSPAGRHLAFSDQDDVWFPDKLSRAMAALAAGVGPVHYAARTVICDPALRPLTPSRLFTRPFGFRNALVQACMAGNTSVFTPDAAAILRAGLPAAADAGIISHDWWAYQLLSGAGARIINDPEPALYYRQHGGAEMGRNDTANAMARRLGMLMAGDYGDWLAANIRALKGVDEVLMPANRQILDALADALAMPGPIAALRMRRIGLYRHDRAGTLALYAAAAMGRLRRARG